ncbi:MAG: ABC transporter permease [Eubacterium sp.]|nr:ABC transporter permease [Eubacterium sp.]
MKNRLSAWKYIRNNKKTAGVLIIALAFSFMGMYVVYTLLATAMESFKPIMFENPKKVSYISLSTETMGVMRDDYETSEEYEEAVEKRRNEIIEGLKKNPGIEDAYNTQVIDCLYAAVMGQWSYEVPLIDQEQIPEFLEHTGAKLIEGELPDEGAEILVDKVIMKNQDLSVGDWFMEKWWGESFKVCGVIESDGMYCVGTPLGATNRGWYIMVLNDETTPDMTKILSEQGVIVSAEDEIVDAVTNAEKYRTDIKGAIESVVNAIFAVVLIFLAISVFVAYVSFMRNRVNEYCLYASIGYARGDIYGMIIREMLIIFGIGIAAGFILSVTAAGLMNILFIEPKGLISRLIYGDKIYGLIAVYIFIMGLLQLPVLMNIYDIKTIDAIED